MKQKNRLVKLYIYQFENEKIYIDQQEAEDFGEFIIIRLDSQTIRDQVHIEELQNKFTETFPGKKVLIVDQALDLAFYGFRERAEIELTNGS